MTRGQSLLISINRKCCVNNAAKISPIVNFQEEKGPRLRASGIPQSLRECSLDHLEDASSLPIAGVRTPPQSSAGGSWAAGAPPSGELPAPAFWPQPRFRLPELAETWILQLSASRRPPSVATLPKLTGRMQGVFLEESGDCDSSCAGSRSPGGRDPERAGSNRARPPCPSPLKAGDQEEFSPEVRCTRARRAPAAAKREHSGREPPPAGGVGQDRRLQQGPPVYLPASAKEHSLWLFVRAGLTPVRRAERGGHEESPGWNCA
ncbi:uncharacterized protein LOC118993979 [Sturnira hondurensis]|uniref:uncharacterized protein LOC118993979 n=1 Tax=Sturnira hondurensis TaxID=192404 RepID=UPI00187A4934|nr:uncharacterized protein LOC118993979 [Sturnira hondurensis]